MLQQSNLIPLYGHGVKIIMDNWEMIQQLLGVHQFKFQGVGKELQLVDIIHWELKPMELCGFGDIITMDN